MNKMNIYRFKLEYTDEQRMKILRKFNLIWHRQFDKFGYVTVILWSDDVFNYYPFIFYKTYEYRTNGIIMSLRITDYENYSHNDWIDSVPIENIVGIVQKRKRESGVNGQEKST